MHIKNMKAVLVCLRLRKLLLFVFKMFVTMLKLVLLQHDIHYGCHSSLRSVVVCNAQLQVQVNLTGLINVVLVSETMPYE